MATDQNNQQASSEPILTRTDPTAIIAGIGVGLQALDMALDHFGSSDPPQPEPPAQEVILPPGVDAE